MSLVAAVAVTMAVLFAAQSEATMLYTYLLPGQKFCVRPEGVELRGKEDKYMVHYGFHGLENDLNGEVDLSVKSQVWLGPSFHRILDPKHSSVVVELVNGPEYRFCFSYEGSRSKVPLEFEIGRALDNPLVDAPEEQVDMYLDTAQALEAGVNQVADELEFLIQKQEAFEGTVQSAYLRVILFTVISSILVLGTAGWQLWTLKAFFRSKKVV